MEFSKSEIRKSLEIRVSFLKNRIKTLRNNKIKIQLREKRLRKKGLWMDYMSEDSNEEVIKKLEDKLEKAKKDLLLLQINDN